MRQHRIFCEVFAVYWKIYGGYKALLFSPYFQIATAVAIACYPLWWNGRIWAEIVLSSIPNILGFSIGAFAVILSFGQGSLALLKDPVELKSRYLGVISSFVHFIVVQSLALLVALLGKAFGGKVIGFIGCILLAYAITLAVAASMRLFRLARIYNQVKEEGGSKADGD
jgi:hypothetical protein